MLSMYDTLLCEKFVDQVVTEYYSERLYNRFNAERALQLSIYKILYNSREGQDTYILEYLKENYPDVYEKMQRIILDYIYFYRDVEKKYINNSENVGQTLNTTCSENFNWTITFTKPEKPKNKLQKTWNKLVNYIKGLKCNQIKK